MTGERKKTRQWWRRTSDSEMELDLIAFFSNFKPIVLEGVWFRQTWMLGDDCDPKYESHSVIKPCVRGGNLGTACFLIIPVHWRSCFTLLFQIWLTMPLNSWFHLNDKTADSTTSLDLCFESGLSYEEWIRPAGHDVEILNPEAPENSPAVFHCVAWCQTCDDPTHEFLWEAKSFVTLIVILNLVRSSISLEYLLSILVHLCS
jgi:hypothetical protein